jgi:putative FmdB family regulatory protein
MPVYEFQCPNGHITEKIMVMSDDTRELSCYECCKLATRIISKSSFQFKCGGFFATDYARENTSVGSED